MSASIFSIRGVGWMALLVGGWLGAPAVAQALRLTEIHRDGTGSVVVKHQARTGAYYLLQRGTSLRDISLPVAAQLGTAGVATLRDNTALAATGFYRLLEIPLTQPRDTDGDGIDDVYELELVGQLNPLDPTDAGLDPDGNGLSFLQEYQRDGRIVTRIVKTSPTPGESGVAVTRETILHFDRPLAADVVLAQTNLFASFGGRRLLSRIELSSDRRKATLFYLENLPASARVRVTFDASGVRDVNQREVDADGDGAPGGFGELDFDTLGITPLPTTAVIGRVYDSEPMTGPVLSTNRPLAGVTITVDGAEETLRTTTDADGFFKLMPAPAGRFFVHVDGRTAAGSAWPNGAYYPFVGKAWEAVAGVQTNLANGTGEIFLPLVPAGALQSISPTEETKITFAPETLTAHPELAGVEVRVPPNALFADNGTRGGRVGIAPVAPDRLPEPLPQGLNLPLVITIQSDGPMNFDRPVPVRFPNTPDPATGRVKLPGEKSALWSFSHDTGEWEIIGPMTVSADGKFVECDSGVGVLQPGWHGQDPASRLKGDVSQDGKFNSLPPNTADILWNGMQAGFGVAGFAFGLLAAESPIGKGFAAFNLVLDIVELAQKRDGASLLKVGIGAAGLLPGGGVAMRLVGAIVDGGSAAKDTGELIQSATNQNGACNPGAPRPILQSRRNGVRLAGPPGVVRDPPPTYFARHYYQGPQQTAAIEALRVKADAFNAELRARSPIYNDLIALNDQFLAASQVIVADPNAVFTPAQIAAYTDLATAWASSLDRVVKLPLLSDQFREVIREYSRFQQLFDLNSALVGLDSASGYGNPLDVLLQAHGEAHPLTLRGHYRLTGPGTVQRGRVIPGAPLKFILRPNTVYRLDILDAANLSVASRLFVSPTTGAESELKPILVRPVDQSPDTDGDGLRDFAEGIVGTRPDRADSDGDGVADGAEVQADRNPLDNLPAITGIIGTLPLPGVATDVCLDGDRALVAMGSAGLAVVSVSRVDAPTVIAQVDTPGDARRVACDRTYVAVADGGAGLAIVDISDPPAAFIKHQMLRIGEANCVIAADGLAYVGTQGGDLVAVHLASGTVEDRLPIGGAIHDLAFLRNRLLVLTGTTLHVVDLGGDTMEILASQPVSLFAEGLTGRRRVSVGGNLAYVTSYPGYSIVDLTVPSAPVLVGNAVEHGPNSFKQILPTGSGLGVAAVGVNPRDDGTHDVWLYDLSDPQIRTRFSTQFQTPGIARSLALHRGLCFVADGSSGLQTLNFLAADTGTTPPTIRLDASFPLHPAVVESGAYAALIAEAADDVLVRDVEFYVDGDRVFTDGNYPFEYRLRVPKLTAEKTNLVLRARAFDTGGNATWSDEITVTIGPDVTPPKARPAAPAADGFAVSPTVISAIFNEPIDEATLTPQRLTLTFLGADRQRGTADDVPIEGEIGYVADARLAELRFPTVPNAGRYEAVLLRGVTDLAGNATTNDTVWAFEVVIGTDTDGDGLTDDFETANGLNPLNADENHNGILDSIEDFDGDGLTNGQEMLLGTNPRQPRTFGGVLDSQLDRDGDYLTDVRELVLGTDWTRWDTDGDGWNDEIEMATGDSPLRPNAYLHGIRVARQTGYALRPAGPEFRSAQGDVLRIGEGQAMQATSSGNVLRLGSPNENGHSIVAANPPVRVRIFDPEDAGLSPYELPRPGAFVIEGEDYDYDGGQQVPAASLMPYLGGAYNDRVGVLDVDYFNADAADSQLYRPLPAPNNINLLDNLLGRYGRERPGWTVNQNFRVGSPAAGDWQQYTRSIPAGEYWVWAALSHPGTSPGQLFGTLDLVTGDPTPPGPGLLPLGFFNAPGSGGVGRNDLVLLRDGGGTPATVIIDQPATTLRFNLGSGDLDWFVLVPVTSAP